MPALDRYDGGSFRVLRKPEGEDSWPARLDVLVLSAKYGLIEASQPIGFYEQRMIHSRAEELRTQVLGALKGYLWGNVYEEVYIDLGKDYLPAIEGTDKLLQEAGGEMQVKVTYAKGRIGERLSALKRWLASLQARHVEQESKYTLGHSQMLAG